jgi:aminoglycoside phosphotransferase (APT) family kinase protein
MLSQSDVGRYLLDRGLVTASDLVDGELVVRDVSSRNRNYRAETREGPCYLLKQAIGAEMLTTVGNEAAAYERLALGGGELGALLPGYYGYDTQKGLLVIESVRGAETLRALQSASGRFPTRSAAALGRALGLLHRETAIVAAAAPEQAPGILRIHRPHMDAFREMSAASLELIRIVQQGQGFPEALERVRGSWTPEAFVHGDVKWDNCLVVSEGAVGEMVKLIDWEMATVGDPGWDIGSALSAYLSFWIFSIPTTGEMPPERFPELAVHPLDSMKPALNACWNAYSDVLEGSASEAEARLVHAVELAAARLVQTGFEVTQAQQQLWGSVVLHLQLAQNMLERPREAATRLLGIDPSLGLR